MTHNSRRTAILFGLLMVLPTIASGLGAGAPTAPPTPDPDEALGFPSAGELPAFSAGTQAFLAENVAEETGSPIYRIFAESFDGPCSGLPDGWSQEIARGPSNVWHRDCLVPADFAAGLPTAIVHSPSGSASIRQTSGGYSPGIDARLVTPVIDLRYVAGAAKDTNAATDFEPCSVPGSANASTADTFAGTAAAPATETMDGVERLCRSAFTAHSLHGYVATARRLFLDYVKGFPSTVVSQLYATLAATPAQPSEVPLTPESYGFGMVNLSFWHYWDFDARDGGIVEIRYQKDDGTWSSWRTLDGDLIFETSVPYPEVLQELGCQPWLLTRGVDETYRRPVTPLLCEGYGHWSQDGGPVEGTTLPLPRSIGTGPPAPSVTVRPAEPGVPLSSLLSRILERKAPQGPNGHVDVDQNPTTPDPAGFVGNSGQVTYTKYTLNRFIGKQVQVAFRAASAAEIEPVQRGWFVDDVEVAALLPSRDVGVLSVAAPRDGDLVNVAHNALRPTAVVKNFGRERAERVNASFTILSEDGGRVLWGPHYQPNHDLALDPLGTATVSPRVAWVPPGPGTYQLRVAVRLDPALRPDGPHGLPETDVNGENNQARILFRARDVPLASLKVLVDGESVQTDIGDSKRLSVALENVGNLNLTGALRLVYRTVDLTGSTPRPSGPETVVREWNVVAGELPFGRNLTSTGFTQNRLLLDASWNPQGVPAGVYVLEAVFVTSGGLRFESGPVFTYIRATPPAPFVERFTPRAPGASPYPVQSVESLLLDPLGAPAWLPNAEVYCKGSTCPHGFNLPSGWVTLDPTIPEYGGYLEKAAAGAGVWMAHGEDCRAQAPPACAGGTTNLIDWYVLRREIDIRDATDLSVSFLSQGHLTYLTDVVENRTRGLVRILPKNMTWFQDYGYEQVALAQAIGATPDGVEVQLVDLRRTEEDGFAIENRTVRINGVEWNLTYVLLTKPHYWTKVDFVLDPGRYGTSQLAVEWVLETDRNRKVAFPSSAEPWCTSTAPAVSYSTCSLVKADRLNRWYLDAIRIEARKSGSLIARFYDGGNYTNTASTDPLDSRQQFAECRNAAGAFQYTQGTFFCRGWALLQFRPTTAISTPFPANWYLAPVSLAERSPDTSATATEAERTVLCFGVADVRNAPSNWCRSTDSYGRSVIGAKHAYSTVRGPVFSLTGFADPVLSFWTNFTLNSAKLNYGFEDDRVLDGFSVWLVGTKDGAEKFRAILNPQDGYTARIYAKPPTGVAAPGDLSLRFHPYNATYDATSGNNVWNGVSNPTEDGRPRWIEAVFDLSPYVGGAYAGMEFAVEFHAVTQNPDDTRLGFWRIDDVTVEERSAANDVGVTEVIAPIAGRVLGPGVEQNIVAKITNSGLFPQRGVAVNYTIRDSSNRIVASGDAATPGGPIPGLLADDPERNRTVAFPQTWTPAAEGAYRLRIETRLDQSDDPFADTVPGNNATEIPIVVRAERSVRIQGPELHSDEAAISPLIAGISERRSFRIPVENIGTLREEYSGDRLGLLSVTVKVTRETGESVLELTQPIQSLEIGEVLMVTFRDAWKPDASGLYRVNFTLNVPADGDLPGLPDNSRLLKVIVFNDIVPLPGETWSSRFSPTGAWRSDEDRTGPDGFTFGGPYANLANGTLNLRSPENLRSIRNLFLVLNHSYDFEEGYDGAVVEVSKDGIEWYTVPPRSGYPVEMSSASPLSPDPFQPVRALSGTQSAFAPMDFNLGAVKEILDVVPFVKTDFGTTVVPDNPFLRADGTMDLAALEARPHSGSNMLYSDKYAMKCGRLWTSFVWRTTPTTVLTTETIPVSVSFPARVPSTGPLLGAEWCKAGWEDVLYDEPITHTDGLPAMKRYKLSPGTGSQAKPLLETQKSIQIPLRIGDRLAGTTVTADTKLVVSFWDWRALGTTVRVSTGAFARYVDVQNANGIEVTLCCDVGGIAVPLVPYDPSGAYDKYRDWSTNEFTIAGLLARMPNPNSAYLTFTHYVASGFPKHNYGGAASVDYADPSDTDWLSPHMGWAIDDIRVFARNPTADTIILDDDLEGNPNNVPTKIDPGSLAGTYRPICREREGGRAEFACDTAASTPTTTIRGGWKFASRVGGHPVWSIEPSGSGGGRALVARPPASGTAAQTGGEARLAIPVDLKSAVNDVFLEFDTAFKFSIFRSRETPVNLPYPHSGGRIEVSVDEGATWIPVDPVAPEAGSHRYATTWSIGGSGFSTHTPLAGASNDPEKNSPFGLNARSLYGATAGYNAGMSTLVPLKFDLTSYAGKEILVGFRAFFTTTREASIGTDPSLGPDGWKIDNLRLTGAIFDVRDLHLRLRALADESVTAEGWDVSGLRFLGVKHQDNLALRILPRSEGGLIGQGPEPLALEVVNKGQRAATEVALSIWVNATGPRAETYSWSIVDEPLHRFGACPGDPALLPGSPVLAPESSTRICSRGGLPLEVVANAEHSYTITARISHTRLPFESVLADNRAEWVPGPVLAAPVIRVHSLSVSPNALDERLGGDVNVTVELENYGVSQVILDGVDLTLTDVDGGPGLPSPPVVRNETTATVSAGGFKFSTALEKRTLTWILPASEFADRRDGIYEVRVVAKTQGGETRAATTLLYAGTNVFQHLAFDDHVTTIYDLSNPGPLDRWYRESNAASCAYPFRPWEVVQDSSAEYTNNTARWAFALPRQGPRTPPGDGGGAPPPCVLYNFLRTPALPVEHAVGPDGKEHLWLTFYSRHSFRGTGGTVSIEPKYPGGQPVLVNTKPILFRLSGETPDYTTGRFVPYTFDVLEALRNWREGTSQEIATLAAADIGSFYLYFRYNGELERAWQIDDVSVSPIGLTLGPSKEYLALDDTDKSYPVILQNAGSYSDSYKTLLTDATGGTPVIPPGWYVTLADPAGRILWPSQANYTAPPAGCNPTPAPTFASRVALDPGETARMLVRVCIPVSEDAAGRSGRVELGVTSWSDLNRFQAATAQLSLAYNYRLWPNLVVQSGGIRVDNPELPVDQPRTVTVNVLNVGPVDAHDVEVRVVDSMDPRFGYEPRVLPGLDGNAAAPIRAIASGSVQPISFVWTPRAVGEHNLTVDIDVGGKLRELNEADNGGITKLFITRSEYPDLVVELAAETLEPVRGTPAWVRMSVTNVGGKAASGVQLTFKAGVTDFLARGDDFLVRIDPGETVHVNRTWRPAFPGKLHLVGGALPKAGILERVDTQKDNYAILEMLVRSKSVDVTAASSQVRALPGASASLSLAVTNGGETADEYDLAVSSPAGVLAFLTKDGVRRARAALEPGANATFELALELPPRIAAGTYPVNVTVASRLSGAVGRLAAELVVLPEYGLALETTPAASSPGTKAFSIVVHNDGNTADAVTVAALGLPAGWTATPGTRAVPPYGTATINVTLAIPTSQTAAVYEVFLVASNAPKGALANATLLVELTEFESIVPRVVGNLRGVRAGEVLALEVEVENTGNVRGEAAIVANPPAGWQATLGRSLVALRPGETARLPLSLLIPRTADGGTFDLRIESEGSRSNSSHVGRVVVAESDLKVEDLVFSPRVNIEPGTVVRFNATVRNEGYPARDVAVAFYVNDFLVGVEKVALLGIAGSATVPFTWVATSGEHVVLVIADPANSFEEKDEANNARLEVIRALVPEEGVLAAARRAIPEAGPALALVVVAVAALAIGARRRLR